MGAFLSCSYRSSEMGGGVGDDWITEGQHRRCVWGTEDQHRPWAGCRGLWALVLNRRLLPGGAPSLGQILALGDGPPISSQP